MQSEFYNVALDCIRYSLVWEDSATLYQALAISPPDHVLVITSAGCNVLNALLQHPASITAIDVNPVQNGLLLLKKHIFLYHDHATLRACLGLDGREAGATAWKEVRTTLPEALLAYWDPFFTSHPEGLLTAGRLETYVNGFYNTLDENMQDKLTQLLRCKQVKEQYTYFLQELHDTPFTAAFIEYFGDKSLSRGRDPRLFRYAEESGGEAFYSRLVQQISSVLISSNFYFRFFFFGPLHIPDGLLPPCYQQQNFEPVKKALSKLRVVTGEAIEYLLSPAGKQITKGSLSNIFEYTSESEFAHVCRLLYKEDRALQLVFWNLLHEQGQQQAAPGVNMHILDSPSTPQSCFYFKGVRVLTGRAADVPEPESIKQ